MEQTKNRSKFLLQNLMGRDRNVDERIIRNYILKQHEISKMESVDCGLAVIIRLL
jgi:hypothetical protein